MRSVWVSVFEDETVKGIFSAADQENNRAEDHVYKGNLFYIKRIVGMCHKKSDDHGDENGNDGQAGKQPEQYEESTNQFGKNNKNKIAFATYAEVIGKIRCNHVVHADLNESVISKETAKEDAQNENGHIGAKGLNAEYFFHVSFFKWFDDTKIGEMILA